MATVEFITFCDYAFKDEHNRPCIVGLLPETLVVPGFPVPMAQLTIAVLLRIPSGERSRIRIEFGPEGERAARAVQLDCEGPPADVQNANDVVFVPVHEVMLYFKDPHTIIARVLEGETVLATRSLRLCLAPQPTSDPDGL
jgi:hypothetical protein